MVAQRWKACARRADRSRFHCVAFRWCPQDAWLEDLNPESLLVVRGAYATPELAKAQAGDR